VREEAMTNTLAVIEERRGAAPELWRETLGFAGFAARQSAAAEGVSLNL